MSVDSSIPGWKDKILFTPGPLTTSQTVKQAMLRDWGSRDTAFIEMVRDIRRQLVELATKNCDLYTAVLMQGSGTFGVESAITSTVPPNGKLLVVSNGSYARRIIQIGKVAGISTTAIEWPEHETIDPAAVDKAIASDQAITTVAMVHCETTTGMFLPIEEIGAIVHRHGRRFIVDAMSSFGAVPLDVDLANVDYLVSSANKCIEGVPGFSFIIARRSSLMETESFARSLSLDLLAQWKGLDGNGQFRFTPPTHALLAFHQALREIHAEGGVEGRANRYRRNYQTLIEGMRKLGFTEYLAPDRQGYIITSFRNPEHPNYDFEDFYSRLSDRGYVIYPGKVSDADCFRIGNIGRIFESDVRDLLSAISDVLATMGVELTVATANKRA